MASANILVSTIHNGDAVSQHTFDLARLLSRKVDSVRILNQYPVGAVPADIHPLVRIQHLAQGLERAEIQILQYGIWFSLAELFRATPDPALFWYHGVTPPALWQGGDRFDLLRNAQIRTDLAWHAHLAVADSPFGAAELHQNSAYPLDQIRVVPLGFDLAQLGKSAHGIDAAQLRTQLHLDGCQVLLFVGRIAGNKRIDLLVDALGLLASDRPDLRLMIVGDTDANDSARFIANNLRKQAAALGLTDKIVFAGKVDAVEPYYHMADLLVHASQHEGFCAPLVEAMAAGKPVIVSRNGSMPWVAGTDDHESGGGVAFESGDVEDLARQIKRLLDDQELARRLAAQARQRAENFSLEKFDQRAYAVIQETIDLAANGVKPIDPVRAQHFYADADIALRHYRVRSGAPLIGRLIEWVRTNSTSHIKEAYIDRIIEQQVNYNRLMAAEIYRLQEEIEQLRSRLNQQDKP